MRTFKDVTRIVFGLVFVAAGLNHFVNPAFYLSIMPPYLPWHGALVGISGIAEIGLGIALMVPRFGRAAAWGLIILLIAIFPANIHMIANPDLYPAIPQYTLWLRLPIQGLLILWAFWYTRSED